MLQVSLKRQLRNMSEVASGECQCVCVCVSQIASAILLTAQLFTKIYKKQNKISCNACWSTLVQWNATKIYFKKKKTRQWPWNLQHLATPTICATKQPKLLQHKDKLHQQQHFAWWAQIQSEGLCWSSDLKIHPWVKDTVMIMMIIMIHIVFQSALIYLSSFAWCTLIPLIFGDYDVSPYIKTQYHLIWSLPVWWCLSPFLLINPRCQGTCGINPPSDEYPNKKPYLTCEAMVRFTISYPLEAVKHDVYIYIYKCMYAGQWQYLLRHLLLYIFTHVPTEKLITQVYMIHKYNLYLNILYISTYTYILYLNTRWYDFVI